MKPAPSVPGDTPWDKMDNAVRKIFSVLKGALLKEEKKRERVRARKRAVKPKPQK